MNQSVGLLVRGLTSLLIALVAIPAQAALHGRLPATPGGSDYQAYYDDLLDITWVADGNLPVTQSFGITAMGWSTSGFGAMDWDTAQQWIVAMNDAGYLGVSDWRQTRVVDLDGPDPDDLGGDGCNLAYFGTDCGWNVDPATGEIAHLYYVTLGNFGGYDPAGVHQDWCDTGMPAPPACLVNVGPFSNFFPNHYWTSTETAFDVTKAWEFNARIGVQNYAVKTRISYVWAVRDGDIDADEDEVASDQDNCSDRPNPDQLDSDFDGYGNDCDADLDNSGLVTATDFNILRSCLNRPSTTSAVCAAADMNGSGLVTTADFNLLRARMNTAPGPSGLHATAYPSPFLPYGSHSASVVFRHPLTGNPNGTGGLTATIYGAGGGPEHDAVKGMRGAAAGGTTASGYYLTGFSAATLNSLDAAGQISFEISTRYFTQTADNGGGSNGDSLAASTTPIHFANGASPGSGQIYVLRRSAGGGGAARVTTEGTTIANSSQRSFIGWVDADASGSAGLFNSYGKPADGFTRINVGWYDNGALGDIIVMAVDGVVLQWATRDDTVNPFTHFALGGAVHWFNQTFVNSAEELTDANHWIRNLQISTLAPTVPTLTAGPLRTIAIMSDSIIPASAWYDNNVWRDINIDARIIRSMEAHLIRPTTLYRMQAGGHTMINGIGPPSFASGDTATQIASSGSTSADVRGLIKALNPTTIIINGGSNDVGDANANATNFRAALRDHVEYFCGLDGTSHGGTDYSASPPGVMPSYVFFTNIPDRGFRWDNAATATGTLNGTTTVSSVSVPGSFADGDLIGAYESASAFIPAGTTVVSGGGSTTIVLSQPAVGFGSANLYKLTEHADSMARQKAGGFRDEIRDMPAWFAASFPTSPVKVRVIDTFTATGGTAIIPGKIREDGVHPDYYGIYNGNEAIAAALVGTL